MVTPQLSSDNPSFYINRELSWIRFNRHVLDEALDETHPLLERVKFLAIFANNLDEFFMVRVSGLQRQLVKGVLKSPPDGMTPGQQLESIRKMLIPELEAQYYAWHEEILPRLDTAGIHVHMYAGLSDKQKNAIHTFFVNEIFPVLTPLAFDSFHPFPFISNLSINLAIIIRDTAKKEYFARVKVPTNLFSRLVRIPDVSGNGHVNDSEVHFIYLEEIIAAHLDMLFPGLEVIGSFPFRVTRDADLAIEVDEASDLLTTVEEIMEQRAKGNPIRIEVDHTMHEGVCHMLEKKLGVSPSMLYRIGHPVGMADFMQLLSLDRPDLKDVPFPPSLPSDLSDGKDIFSAIRHHNILCYIAQAFHTDLANFHRHDRTHFEDTLIHEIGCFADIFNAFFPGSFLPAGECFSGSSDCHPGMFSRSFLENPKYLRSIYGGAVFKFLGSKDFFAINEHAMFFTQSGF
jgi:polyphosphate kinase